MKYIYVFFLLYCSYKEVNGLYFYIKFYYVLVLELEEFVWDSGIIGIVYFFCDYYGF